MADSVESRLRRVLLILSAFIFPGIVLELLLQDHTKEPLQLVPFVLCLAGFVVVVFALLRPQKPTLLALRYVMMVIGAGGAVGAGVHLLKNIAFEREIRPNLALSEAVIAAFKGANPLLAPGILALAAALALAATYYHPALGKRDEMTV